MLRMFEQSLEQEWSDPIAHLLMIGSSRLPVTMHKSSTSSADRPASPGVDVVHLQMLHLQLLLLGQGLMNLGHMRGRRKGEEG